MKRETCEFCKHWKKDSESAGVCKRFPPQVIVRDAKGSTERFYSVFPTTVPGDVCGEWQNVNFSG